MEALDLGPLDTASLALFLDVDGTLLDFAATPDRVETPYSLIEHLGALELRLGGALALVSGRPIAQLDALFAPLALRASGVHGGEIRDAPNGPIASQAREPLDDNAWRDLQRVVENFPVLLLENKSFSFAVHYRGSEAAARSLKAALQAMIDRRPGPALELIEGRFVFEVKLAGFDKGRAIDHFMARAPFAGRIPVFVADDALDRPGFERALALGGRAYSVGHEIPYVSGWFPTAGSVRAWIERLAR
jgi:trehalose 6-phosphate phosphatase